MKDMGAPETWSQRSGKTRQSDAAPSRQIRRAKLHGFAMAQRDAKHVPRYRDPREEVRERSYGFRRERRGSQPRHSVSWQGSVTGSVKRRR